MVEVQRKEELEKGELNHKRRGVENERGEGRGFGIRGNKEKGFRKRRKKGSVKDKEEREVFGEMERKERQEEKEWKRSRERR